MTNCLRNLLRREEMDQHLFPNERYRQHSVQYPQEDGHAHHHPPSQSFQQTHPASHQQHQYQAPYQAHHGVNIPTGPSADNVSQRFSHGPSQPIPMFSAPVLLSSAPLEENSAQDNAPRTHFGRRVASGSEEMDVDRRGSIRDANDISHRGWDGSTDSNSGVRASPVRNGGRRDNTENADRGIGTVERPGRSAVSKRTKKDNKGISRGRPKLTTQDETTADVSLKVAEVNCSSDISMVVAPEDTNTTCTKEVS